MKGETESATNWMLLSILIVLLVGVSVCPTRAEGQAGNNAVYANASTCCAPSSGFIDASMFASKVTSPNFCSVLNYVLANVVQRGLAHSRRLKFL